jgi:hypothetical protein
MSTRSAHPPPPSPRILTVVFTVAETDVETEIRLVCAGEL